MGRVRFSHGYVETPVDEDVATVLIRKKGDVWECRTVYSWGDEAVDYIPENYTKRQKVRPGLYIEGQTVYFWMGGKERSAFLDPSGNKTAVFQAEIVPKEGEEWDWMVWAL